MGKVGGPVQAGVMWNELAALVGVAVDGRRNAGQLGDEIHRVLVHRVPVIELADSLLVCRRKVAVRLLDNTQAKSAQTGARAYSTSIGEKISVNSRPFWSENSWSLTSSWKIRITPKHTPESASSVCF